MPVQQQYKRPDIEKIIRKPKIIEKPEMLPKLPEDQLDNTNNTEQEKPPTTPEDEKITKITPRILLPEKLPLEDKKLTEENKKITLSLEESEIPVKYDVSRLIKKPRLSSKPTISAVQMPSLPPPPSPPPPPITSEEKPTRKKVVQLRPPSNKDQPKPTTKKKTQITNNKQTNKISRYFKITDQSGGNNINNIHSHDLSSIMRDDSQPLVPEMNQNQETADSGSPGLEAGLTSSDSESIPGSHVINFNEPDLASTNNSNQQLNNRIFGPNDSEA